MQNLITTTTKNPNPQGKGCVPVLQDLAALRSHSPGPKSPGDILRDYCLSALVLAAEFRFRPVPGQSYYLYSDEQEWKLSLIAPREWGARIPGQFVAKCCLRDDMTWQLDFGRFRADSSAAQRLQRFIDGFASTISAQHSLLDALPFYASELPYFQRILATGLAGSLQHSISEVGADRLRQSLPLLSPALQ